MSPAVIVVEALGVILLAVVTLTHLIGVRDRKHGLLEAVGVSDRPASRMRSTWKRWLRRSRTAKKLTLKLEGAGLNWSAEAVLGTSLAAMIVCSAATFQFLGRLGPIIMVGAIWFGLQRWLERRRQQRVDRFVAQLPELARLLANGASAGLAVRQSLALAAREMVEPATSELSRVVAEIDVGSTLSQSMTRLSERLPSRELSVLVQTLIIQSRSGGELVTALSHIADTLDERKQLRREVRTASAGSTFSGAAVLVMGLGSVFVMNLLSPGALDAMISQPMGLIALAVAGVLFAAGAIAIARISKVEI